MNASRDFVRTSIPGLSASRAFPAFPRPSGITTSRAGLPVVSNRAFISAWVTRRNKLVAAAQLGRAN